MKSLRRWAFIVFGVTWALPYTLVGMVVGLIATPFGARPRLDSGDFALIFHRFPWGPGGAMTLGNVILNTHAHLNTQCTTYAHRAGWCVEPKARIGDHERAHVLQYMALGLMFLPLYFLHGGISARNRFERAADRYALTGKDWWPWLKVNARPADAKTGSKKTSKPAATQ